MLNRLCLKGNYHPYMQQLNYLNRMNYCHCDIHDDNLVNFGKHGWQLLDYDKAIDKYEGSKAKSGVKIEKNTPMHFAAGDRIQKLLEESSENIVTIQDYSFVDDVEMLSHLIIKS